MNNAVTGMIKRRVLIVQKLIKKYETELKELQDSCQHPQKMVSETHDSSTGGYDGPSSDRYWTTYHCANCDKRWTKHMDEHGREIKI